MALIECEYFDLADQQSNPGRLAIEELQINSTRVETVSPGVYRTIVKMNNGSSFVLKGSQVINDSFIDKV